MSGDTHQCTCRRESAEFLPGQASTLVQILHGAIGLTSALPGDLLPRSLLKSTDQAQAEAQGKLARSRGLKSAVPGAAVHIHRSDLHTGTTGTLDQL